MRPLGVGEILDGAIQLWKRSWKQLLPLALLIMLPFQILSALASTSIQESPDHFVQTDPFSGEVTIDRDLWVRLAGVAGAALLTYMATLVVSAAMTWYLGEVLLDRPADPHEAVTMAVKRSGVVVLNWIVAVLLALLVAAAAIVPTAIVSALIDNVAPLVIGIIAMVPAMVWLWLRFQVSTPAIVIERLGPIAALRRSFRLVSGRWWPVFVVVILASLLGSVVSGVVSSVIALPISAAADNRAVDVFATSIGGTLGAALVAPFSAAMLVLVYFDLRVRKEAFDLELLATSLDASRLSAPQT